MNERTAILDRKSAAEPVIDESQPTAATNVELVAELGDIGALRGVTEAAADLAECTCPGPCERDHANE
jgi:hypothetical protein